MENLILLFHVLVALVIVGLILLQQGKGAEMGASFGSGASQTLFGASGSGNFFSKMTAIFAFVFFVTSFSLAVIAKQNANLGEDIPAVLEEEVLPSVEDDLPEVGDAAEADDLPAVPDSAEADVLEDDIPAVESDEAAETAADEIPEE